MAQFLPPGYDHIYGHPDGPPFYVNLEGQYECQTEVNVDRLYPDYALGFDLYSGSQDNTCSQMRDTVPPSPNTSDQSHSYHGLPNFLWSPHELKEDIELIDPDFHSDQSDLDTHYSSSQYDDQACSPDPESDTVGLRHGEATV